MKQFKRFVLIFATLFLSAVFVTCSTESDGKGNKDDDNTKGNTTVLCTWFQEDDKTNYYIFYSDKTVEGYIDGKIEYPRNTLTYSGTSTAAGTVIIKTNAGTTLFTFTVTKNDDIIIAVEKTFGTKYTTDASSNIENSNDDTKKANSDNAENTDGTKNANNDTAGTVDNSDNSNNDNIGNTDDIENSNNNKSENTDNAENGNNNNVGDTENTENNNIDNTGDKENSGNDTTENTEQSQEMQNIPSGDTLSALTYTVTIVSDIVNGTVVADKMNTAAGTTVILTARPSDGYVLNSFKVTDASGNSVIVINNSFIMPESNVTISATFVMPAPIKGSPNEVGDVVLNDGTAIAYENITSMTDAQKAAAVAVIFYTGGEKTLGTKVLGVGLTNTQSEEKKGLAWSSSTTVNTYFQSIECVGSTTALTVEHFAFGYGGTMYFVAGDFDGSDNWDKVKEYDPMGAEDAATNYPAFNWANTYGTAHFLTGTIANGWYLPSAVELYILFKEINRVNASLVDVGGTRLQSNANYWASNQAYSNPSKRNQAWYRSANSLYIDSHLKESEFSVCAIREF